MILPAEFDHVSSDKHHPWYRSEVGSLVIFLNGAEVTSPAVKAVAGLKGYVRVIKKDREGNIIYRRLNRRGPLKEVPDTFVVKGDVRLFVIAKAD